MPPIPPGPHCPPGAAEREVERLMDCARKHGRYGHRDATMILVAYRHGLRASEVCHLQWQQIELSEGRLHVHRVKNGIASVHPIRGDEIHALRKLRRDYLKEAYVFVSERTASSSASARLPRCLPPTHAAPRLRLQVRQRWPRHTGSAALPRPPEHPAYGPVHRNGPRPVQGLLERLTLRLGAAASGRRQARDNFRFPLNHLGICRSFTLGKLLFDVLDRALDLFGRHVLDRIAVLDLVLAGN